MKIHFISGLPRSGSTLLVAILRQNPAFRADVSLATLRVLRAVEFATSRENEVSVFLTEDQKWALRHAVFTALYGDSGGRTVFDKNHLWCSRMPLIAALFPQARVICLVRDVPWIMDSFERLYLSNPLEMAAMYGFRADTTIYTRVTRMAASDGVVGQSLDALREAYYGAHKGSLLLIDYKDLAVTPHVVMERIYRFIGEPQFAHDFDNVEFSSPVFDEAVGLPGLHTVKPKVKFQQRESILPPDLFNRFVGDAFWTRKPDGHRRVMEAAE